MTVDNEALASLARTKEQADKSFVGSFEKARVVARALYAFGAAIVAMTVWITTVQIAISQHSKEIALNTEARDANKSIQQALKTGIDANAEAVRRNEASVKALQQKVYGFVP